MQGESERWKFSRNGAEVVLVDQAIRIRSNYNVTKKVVTKTNQTLSNGKPHTEVRDPVVHSPRSFGIVLIKIESNAWPTKERRQFVTGRLTNIRP